jgi:hypothetical protein
VRSKFVLQCTVVFEQDDHKLFIVRVNQLLNPLENGIQYRLKPFFLEWSEGETSLSSSSGQISDVHSDDCLLYAQTEGYG